MPTLHHRPDRLPPFIHVNRHGYPIIAISYCPALEGRDALSDAERRRGVQLTDSWRARLSEIVPRDSVKCNEHREPRLDHAYSRLYHEMGTSDALSQCCVRVALVTNVGARALGSSAAGVVGTPAAWATALANACNATPCWPGVSTGADCTRTPAGNCTLSPGAIIGTRWSGDV